MEYRSPLEAQKLRATLTQFKELSKGLTELEEKAKKQHIKECIYEVSDKLWLIKRKWKENIFALLSKKLDTERKLKADEIDLLADLAVKIPPEKRTALESTPTDKLWQERKDIRRKMSELFSKINQINEEVSKGCK